MIGLLNKCDGPEAVRAFWIECFGDTEGIDPDEVNWVEIFTKEEAKRD
jgi:hypothetical protein